jgi:hypothetical protein
MLMNNIGDPIHEQVVDAEIIPIFVKIVKKKVIFFPNQRLLCYGLLPMLIFPYSLFGIFLCLQSDLPVRERIFLLLDATQTSLGGASGKFPQYYKAYYDLVVGAYM